MRWSEEDLTALLYETDLFKLGIRGQAAVEAEVDAAVEEAFPAGLPGELTKLTFDRRLAILVGLDIVPHRWVGPLKALARLRNDLAHGKIDTVTPQRANALAGMFRAQVSQQSKKVIDQYQLPSQQLAMVVATAQAVVSAAALIARERRKQEREAVEFGQRFEELIGSLPKPTAPEGR